MTGSCLLAAARDLSLLETPSDDSSFLEDRCLGFDERVLAYERLHGRVSSLRALVDAGVPLGGRHCSWLNAPVVRGCDPARLDAAKTTLLLFLAMRGGLPLRRVEFGAESVLLDAGSRTATDRLFIAWMGVEAYRAAMWGLTCLNAGLPLTVANRDDFYAGVAHHLMDPSGLAVDVSPAFVLGMRLGAEAGDRLIGGE
ncbi:hypothetical protein [Bifidobacterium callimiconis]|uniref:Uncharacterized protein n=1 Tax=Bifidobacterium callimiconis TaxID=2306973 RepID=A0A430FEH2_9BIFI|nr:hypothetical protein [Bifidobacterium callimiconis]RSX51249.1 hypothetical protein D2E23_1094 [Bifidobacterium callimiconis]